MSLRLIDVAQSEFCLQQEPIWFGGVDDYQQFSAPRVLRHSSQLEAEYVFRRKLRANDPKLAPVVIACTLQVAAAVIAYDPETRLVVSTDATPALTGRLYHRIGVPWWRRQLKTVTNGALSWRYRALIANVRAWLPMSETCKRSLIDDYGVPPDLCFVTRSPQVEIANSLPARNVSGELEVLLVANDFALKGGKEMVAAVRALDRVRLTIISNDIAARAVVEPGKIEVISGLRSQQQLIPYYRAAHLLVHPTTRDCYSHVMCEALSQGCPVAVSEGVPPAEIVDESGAGWVIRTPSDADAIAELLGKLLSRPMEIEAKAEAAIHYAKTRLSMEQFGVVVRSAVTRAVDGG